MEREAKAKVVASVWGADFVQFLTALAVLPRSIWNNRMNPNRPRQNSYSAARIWAKSASQTDATTFCLCFCLHPSSMTSRFELCDWEVLTGLYILHLVLPFLFFIIIEVLSWSSRQQREDNRTILFTILGTARDIGILYHSKFSLRHLDSSPF